MEILKGKNILIVDDDAYNIFALTAALEDFEANIISVNNGVDAVTAVTSDDQVIDIVLMDIMMPDMDGYEAMRTIREKGYANLPIVALTAKAMRGDIEKCFEAGASEYMSKPIDVAKLVELMEKLLSKESL